MPLISTKECLCLFQASTWISTLHVLVFIVVSDFEVKGDCLFCWYWWNCWPSWHTSSLHNNISHIIIEYKEDHWLNLFMFCKLQHGKLEGIQYLQSSMACKSLNHFICICSWLGTMCDIWPVIDVSSMMNATCGTEPYLPSSAFVSNSSFNGVPVTQPLVF
jgi:hypothetical protein